MRRLTPPLLAGGLLGALLALAYEATDPLGPFSGPVVTFRSRMTGYAAACLAGWVVAQFADGLLRLPRRPSIPAALDAGAARSPIRAWLRGYLLFLASAVPVWAWSVWSDPWVFPLDPYYLVIQGAGSAALTASGFVLVNAGLFAVVRGRRRAGAPSHPPSARGALAVLTALVLLWTLPPLFRRPGGRGAAALATAPPDVLLIVLDTVRADRLSAYGYGLRTSPEIDALAAQGVRFTEFYSTSSWTLPSHASLFTGHYPVRHGATQETYRLSSDATTLAEILGEAGYRTIGISNNPIVSERTGLAQGFDVFLEMWRRRPRGRFRSFGEHTSTAAYERFLAGTPRDRPVFAFLNLIEAHAPHIPPSKVGSSTLGAAGISARERQVAHVHWRQLYLGHQSFSDKEWGLLSGLYDREIAYVSGLVEELVHALDASGRGERTLVIVTADHGENLGDHGHVDHVFSLYRSTLHVPLVLRVPGGRQGQVVDAPAELPDLFPTILEWCGVDPAPYDPDAVELLGLAGAAESVAAEREIFAEYYYPLQALRAFRGFDEELVGEKLAPYLRRLRSIQVGRFKLIWGSDGKNELFDLSTDPGETVNLVDDPSRGAVVADLSARLAAAVERLRGDVPLLPLPEDWTASIREDDGFDKETLQRLRALGYAD